MTEFVFTSPEGRKYRISGPEGATREQAFKILQRQLEAETPPDGGGFMGQTNKTIANVLGAPVDVAAAALNFIPGLNIEKPFGGSESIKGGMRGLNIPIPEGEARTVPEYLGRGVGEAAGMLVPGAGAVSLAARGTGKAAQVAAPLMASMRAHPIQTAVSEVAAGVGAGAGRKVGDVNLDNPTAQFLAEFAGGVVGGAAPSALGYTIPALLWKGGKKVASVAPGAIAPFTSAGAKSRATKRLQSLTADVEQAARAIDESKGTGLSPATATGEKRLMALEQAILDADPEMDSKFIQQAVAAADNLRAQLGFEGSIDDTRRFIGDRVKNLMARTNERIEKAAADAQKRLDALDPAERLTVESEVVREEIDKAFGAERAVEKNLWDSVAKDTPVQPLSATKKYEEIVAALPTAQREDIPAIANRLLNRKSNSFLGEESTINEVWGLRSKLLEEGRLARSRQQFNRAHIAGDLADSLLDDLTRLTGQAGTDLQDALAFSRQLKEKFHQGTVGRILDYQSSGGYTIPPANTLDATMGRGGPRGAVAAQEIMAAGPGAQAPMERYVTRQFVDAATDPSGNIVPTKARDWLDRNEDIFDQFPDLRQRLDAAVEARDVSQLRTGTGEARMAAIADPKRSAAATFLDASPGEEVARVFKSPDPAALSEQLRRQVSKDTSGKALAGLKSSYSDYLIEASRKGVVGETGEREISGRAMLKLLHDKKTRGAFTAIYTPQEMQRIEKIATTFVNLETRRGKLPSVGKPMEDIPGSLLHVAAYLAGAKAGRAMNTNTVQVPGRMAAKFQEFAKWLTKDRAGQLLSDAIQDENLFRALLTSTAPQTTPSGIKATAAAYTRLNAWLAGVAVDRASEREQR
jgi:hypothetical protein